MVPVDRPADRPRALAPPHERRAPGREAGAQITAQVAGRPVGVILGHNTSINPFTFRPAYANSTICRRMNAGQAARSGGARPHPGRASSERELARQGLFIRFVATRWDRMFVMGSPPDYEPTADRSVTAIAARTNRTPDEFAYDYLTEGPENFLFFPVVGYVHGDHEQIRELLLDPATLLGLSDGGAHCGRSSMPGSPPTCWRIGPRPQPRSGYALEHLVRMQTSETADFFGFRDRGRLKPGLRAD